MAAVMVVFVVVALAVIVSARSLPVIFALELGAWVRPWVEVETDANLAKDNPNGPGT